MTKSRHIGKRIGPEHPSWKGMDVHITTKHKWVVAHFGKADHCSWNPEHKSKRFEWANVSKTYKRDASDYIQLCTKCHRKFDSRNKCKRGHEYTIENTYLPKGKTRRQCRKCCAIRTKEYKLRVKNKLNKNES